MRYFFINNVDLVGKINSINSLIASLLNEVNDLRAQEEEQSKKLEEINNDLDINYEVHTWWERGDGTLYLKVTKNPPSIDLREFQYNYFKLDTFVGYKNQYGHKIISCYKQGSLIL